MAFLLNRLPVPLAAAIVLGAMLGGCELSRSRPFLAEVRPGGSIAAQAVAPVSGVHPPGWGSDLEGALATARTSNRKVVVDFQAKWCPPCKKLNSEVLSTPAVSKALEDFERVMVDIDEDGAAASRYGVRGTPTIVFLDPGGNPITRRVGFIPEPAFLQAVDEAQQAN